MVIEERIYNLDPGVPTQDFLKVYAEKGLPSQRRILGGFLGYFTTEFGVQNQVTHMWAFTDLEERRRRRAALAADPDWQECVAIVRPMIIAWENKIMYPTDFSPIRNLPVTCDDPYTAFDFSPDAQ
ncbi:NIPSNAP family protein [Spiractinospora alimapuensis]|uniref:NIPSNAP family protein n=1 Tax=Spiractinospora alimapuensis TaxID=2820884 RepID=UPI001F3D889E|nr:NIPSNAP family protein [Spiractinospora alimapuensis]QVQ53480.1 NIPSNAP family protein [Spiractinospora alimapuensis]